MTSTVFESFAPNAEDVVLWRALGPAIGEEPGRYLCVGATAVSTVQALTHRGWVDHAQQPAATAKVHVAIVDQAAAESGEFEALDLQAVRPWVLVIGSRTEPTAPAPAWEPRVLAAGYGMCLFDGTSRFYVAADRAEQLRPALSYPAGARDVYTRPDERALQERCARAEARADQAAADLASTTDDLVRWRTAALVTHSDPSRRAGRGREARELERELALMRGTLSWRVTKPLRAVRSVVPSRRSD